MSIAIEIENASRVFTKSRKGEVSGTLAVSDVNLKIESGEFVCFIGPSGCGKTTVLNMIAGHVLPTAGVVKNDGRPITGIEVAMGYVTQDDTLLPWRTLERNVSFGLELTGVPADTAKAKTAEFIEKVGLSTFEQHYPHQLSGGMQKRAALIRTLVTEPRVVLMDEPFGAVDAQTRLNLQDQLLRLWQDTSCTVVFVTHDVVEAIALADRIVCFGRNPGHIRSVIDVNLPRPRDVFHIHSTPGFQEIYDRVWKEIHA